MIASCSTNSCLLTAPALSELTVHGGALSGYGTFECADVMFSPRVFGSAALMAFSRVV
jgi:hypothetical protein